jgi:hypothetical protein
MMADTGIKKRLPYVWDYDLDEDEFRAILAGRISKGRLNQDWAASRLLEYASYEEILRLLPLKEIVAGWPRWRKRVRSESRKRGFDFLVRWITEHPRA